jgi:hypothetical protein
VPYDGDSEKVNLSDGNLSVSIPLLTLSGRAGNDLTIVISLDSQTYHLPTVAFYMGTTATTDLYGLWNQLLTNRCVPHSVGFAFWFSGSCTSSNRSFLV